MKEDNALSPMILLDHGFTSQVSIQELLPVLLGREVQPRIKELLLLAVEGVNLQRLLHHIRQEPHEGNDRRLIKKEAKPLSRLPSNSSSLCKPQEIPNYLQVTAGIFILKLTRTICTSISSWAWRMNLFLGNLYNREGVGTTVNPMHTASFHVTYVPLDCPWDFPSLWD